MAWRAAARFDALKAAVCATIPAASAATSTSTRCARPSVTGSVTAIVEFRSARSIWCVRYRTVTTFVYPAAHGFNCNDRDSFDPEAAAAARERTLGHLRKHVK